MSDAEFGDLLDSTGTSGSLKDNKEVFLDELGVFGVEEITPGCLSKMSEFCAVYESSPETIASAWIAFSIKKGIHAGNITVALLEQMEQEVLSKDSSKSTVKTPVSRKTAPRIFTANSKSNDYDVGDEILESYGASKESLKKHQRTPETPVNKRFVSSNRSPSVVFSPASFSPKCINQSAKYSTRTNSGDVIAHLRNEENPAWTCSSDLDLHVGLVHSGSVCKPNAMYMFEKLRDKAGCLYDSASELAEYNLKEEMDEADVVANITELILDDSFVTGRVLCDSCGRMNASSLILEGSESSHGHSVQLDISKLSQYSLFPGQVIVGKGSNPTQSKLVLKELFDGKMLPFPNQAPQVKEPLHLVVAAGPYTTSDTLSFEPLADFTAYIIKHQPHVCIMVGPFVDCRHELIQKGNLPDTFDTVFQNQIDALANALQGTRTQIVLVPSNQDVHHDYVYPTPPFRLGRKYEKIVCAPDPCLLDISGYVVGVTSVDVLMHLGREEISLAPKLSDRLSRLAKHILVQQSFYPLYPPSEDINVDLSHLEDSGRLMVTPHLLVLPSGLRGFAKDVDGCICVNPEHLTKGLVGGCFARVLVKPVDQESYTGTMASKTTVEVVRI